MKKVKKPAENKQIKELRKKVETLFSDPVFKETSKAFRHSVAQRLGVKEIAEGGILLQVPLTKKAAKKMKPTEPGEPGPIWPEPEYSYANIYSYNFW